MSFKNRYILVIFIVILCSSFIILLKNYDIKTKINLKNIELKQTHDYFLINLEYNIKQNLLNKDVESKEKNIKQNLLNENVELKAENIYIYIPELIEQYTWISSLIEFELPLFLFLIDFLFIRSLIKGYPLYHLGREYKIQENSLIKLNDEKYKILSISKNGIELLKYGEKNDDDKKVFLSMEAFLSKEISVHYCKECSSWNDR